MPQSRAFILLRYTLITATAYLLLVEQDFAVPPVPVIAVIVLALASNVIFAQLPRRITQSPYFDGCVVLGDTAWITGVTLYSGNFHSDFFYLYFFVLLLAAIGENLRLIALGAVTICVAYLYLMSRSGHSLQLWTSPSLIRIPFLFTAAAFYGYLVERTRLERGRAREADRIKSEFLATVSHELRTPLNIILGYLQLLLDHSFGPLRPEQEEVLQHAQDAGTTLHRFISHLLDVSRIVSRLETGHETVHCTEVAVESLLATLQSEFPEDLTRVHWAPIPAMPPLLTDKEKFHTIVRNLLDNAVKYSDSDSVSITAHWDRPSDMIEIEVADHGAGIGSRDLQRIFLPFQRGRNAEKSTVPGIGLGLYVVRQFADLLGGDLSVDSTEGAGSTFCMRLPRRFGSPTAAPKKQKQARDRR